ncbi:MAG: DUF5690 family protein [Limisphaerales bacterium]
MHAAAPPLPAPGGFAGLLSRPAFLAAWCAVAAFGTYASMYGFRKPFTAGLYVEAPFGPGFKTWLVTSQVLGYTVSKIIGIRVIAEMPPGRRIATLLGLIGVAQLALVLFGLLPAPWNVACLFLNGLPLGMVFGLVLGFLEGRRMTEAFVAGLCASFILADGLSKSVGAALLAGGVPERWMPAAAGLLFLTPLAGFAWMLGKIPRPTAEDVAARSERTPINRADRRALLRRHGPGLLLITLAYTLITVLRSIRADFAPELWAALGTTGQPGVFTRSEMWVALAVVAVNALAVGVRDNRAAFLLSLGISAGGLLLIPAAILLRQSGSLGAFAFMVLLGIGLYLPYVAVHTTVFERLIALTRDRANLGYLMYVADAAGYLGYVAVMAARNVLKAQAEFLPFFLTASWVVVIVAAGAFVAAAALLGRRAPRTPAEMRPAAEAPEQPQRS